MTKRSIKIYTLLFVCLYVIPFSTYAVKPTPPKPEQTIALNEKTIIQELEKAKGGKLNVLEKIFAKSAIKKARKKRKNGKVEGGEKRGMAIAAMVLGIASLLGVLVLPLFPVAIIAAILAIVLGRIAWSKAKNNPIDYGGKQMAITGFICGIAFIGILIAVVLLFLAVYGVASLFI